MPARSASSASDSSPPAPDERVHQRARPVAWRRMHDHARGLVDDDDVVVFEHNVERDLLPDDLARWRRRNLDSDAIAGVRAVARAFTAVVDRHVAVRDQRRRLRS